MMRCKPMLAYPVSDKPIDYSKPTFIQPKLDGVRCVIQRESDFPGQEYLASFSVKAYSRTGKEWKNIDHILKELKPFFIKHSNVILDGELYNHDLRDNFEKIISLKELSMWHDRLHNLTQVDWDYIDMTEEEDLLSELAKLMTLMNLYTDKEQYEKCSLLKARIRDIKRKLKEHEDDEM